jgi:RNA polymerase sigma-70 factor (ECF subfamily)
MDDDAELLSRWKSGDRACGEQLFARHFRSIFRFFRHKVDETTAEDLTQQTFLACADRRDAFRGESSFRAYLFGIARNHLMMLFRQRMQGRPTVDLDALSLADLGPSPSTLMRASAEQRLLLEALRRIPIDFQIAVELFYWEGMPTADIARVLGVADSTARSRLTRARARLAELVREMSSSPELADRTASGLEQWTASLADLDASPPLR